MIVDEIVTVVLSNKLFLDCEKLPLFHKEIVENRTSRDEKSGARTKKKARGGRGEAEKELCFSPSPPPLSLFLSSPHFSRTLSSLEVRFSTIS